MLGDFAVAEKSITRARRTSCGAVSTSTSHAPVRMSCAAAAERRGTSPAMPTRMGMLDSPAAKCLTRRGPLELGAPALLDRGKRHPRPRHLEPPGAVARPSLHGVRTERPGGVGAALDRLAEVLDDRLPADAERLTWWKTRTFNELIAGGNLSVEPELIDAVQRSAESLAAFPTCEYRRAALDATLPARDPGA